MNKKTLDHLLITLTVLFDFCFVATAIVVAYWIRFESGWIPEALVFHKGSTPPLDDYYRLLPLMALIWITVLKALKLYHPENSVTLSAFWSLCKAAGIALIATLAALFFIFHHDSYSRWVMLLSTGFSLISLFLGRFVLCRFRQAVHAQGVGVQRIAVIGYDARVEKLINTLNTSSNSGYKLIGIIDERTGSSHQASRESTTDNQLRYLGESRDVLDLVQTHGLDTLFIASPTVSSDTILRILGACEGVPVQINVLPELSEFIRSGTAITFFDAMPMFRLCETPMQGMQGVAKRFVDIILSLFALVALSPLMLAIAAAIRLTSPGGAIFCQERVGRAGKRFNIYKFRSMRADAEEKLGHIWAKDDDPRETPLGKFLRRWSLDELPQFFNVLKGDMSLVGPRPEMSGLIDAFRESIPHYLTRQRVKPGMTGWAQVNGLRGNTSLEERVSYDRYYIDTWSLGLDIKIILKTLWAIKKGGR